jgi:hypothetical protein
MRFSYKGATEDNMARRGRVVRVSAGERALLLRLLQEGYGARAWHGATLGAAVRGIAAADAFRRPSAGRHNIHEIVVHAAYWKYVVRRRLVGADEGFPLPGRDWFPSPTPGERAWRAARTLLQAEHRALHDAIARMGTPGGRRPRHPEAGRFRLVLGIACHDVYHAGQVRLVRKLVGA